MAGSSFRWQRWWLFPFFLFRATMAISLRKHTHTQYSPNAADPDEVPFHTHKHSISMCRCCCCIAKCLAFRFDSPMKFDNTRKACDLMRHTCGTQCSSAAYLDSRDSKEYWQIASSNVGGCSPCRGCPSLLSTSPFMAWYAYIVRFSKR